MGAAGKKREEELLAQITSLEQQMRERGNTIADFEGQVSALREQLKMKEADISEHEQTIADLRAKIADLEQRLNQAMQSGDEATNQLRKELQDAKEALE